MNSQNSCGFSHSVVHCGKYGCEPCDVCWCYMCVWPYSSISGFQTPVSSEYCGDYAVEHEITFNCNKTIGVLFCPKKYEQSPPSNVFLNGVRTIFWPSQITWWIPKCPIEGWWWYPETNEIAVLCSKQAQRHICSVLTCSKKYFISCLLHANVCLPTVEQIHTY